jgi:toxin ParE1/3/4
VTAPARFTRRARAELREASAWIAASNRSAAIDFRTAVASLARLIGEHAEVGPERHDIVRPPYRVFVVRGFSYVIIYDPTRRPPVIVRVVHEARDLPDLLSDR